MSRSLSLCPSRSDTGCVRLRTSNNLYSSSFYCNNLLLVYIAVEGPGSAHCCSVVLHITWQAGAKNDTHLHIDNIVFFARQSCLNHVPVVSSKCYGEVQPTSPGNSNYIDTSSSCCVFLHFYLWFAITSMRTVGYLHDLEQMSTCLYDICFARFFNEKSRVLESFILYLKILPHLYSTSKRWHKLGLWFDISLVIHVILLSNLMAVANGSIVTVYQILMVTDNILVLSLKPEVFWNKTISSNRDHKCYIQKFNLFTENWSQYKFLQGCKSVIPLNSVKRLFGIKGQDNFRLQSWVGRHCLFSPLLKTVLIQRVIVI